MSPYEKLGPGKSPIWPIENPKVIAVRTSGGSVRIQVEKLDGMTVVRVERGAPAVGKQVSIAIRIRRGERAKP